MPRRRRASDRPAASPTAPPESAAPSGAPRRPGRLLAAALALCLVAGAAWLPYRSLRETRAQLLLRGAIRERERNPAALHPETNLRRAYRLDPDEPEVVFRLADFLIDREKGRFNAGQFNLIRPENYEEALALLERADAILPFRPVVARLRGEAQWMLGATYERRGETGKAAQARRVAFEELARAARLLPRPRARNEDFNLALFQAAASQRRLEPSIGTLHLIGRLGQRGYLYDIGRGYEEQASLAWVAAGMWPHQGMELRYRLEREPTNPVLLQVASNCARDMDLSAVVRGTLASLDERGRLDTHGRAVLQALPPSSPATPTSPEGKG